MRALVAKVGLVVFGLLLGLGIAEGFVRIVFPHARDAVIPGHLFMIDDDLGWRLAPSKTLKHQTRYFDAQYATNSFGFRDKPRTTAKIAGSYRVLLYGDSLIFGWGLNSGQRFSDLLEAQTPGLEIWNHAVPGWGLDQEIVMYEKEGEPLSADDVIFFVGGSTLSRIHTGYIYAKYKPMFIRQQDGRLAQVAPPKGKNTAVSLIYELLSPFYLPYFLQTQIGALQGAIRSRTAPAADVKLNTIESQQYIDGFSKDLLRIAWNTAQRRHQRMTVLIANLSQADRGELRHFCQETGIGYLDIGPELSVTATTGNNSDLIFGKYDKHWNAHANELIAGQLSLQKNQGLP